MKILLRNVSQYKTLSLDITIAAGAGPAGRVIRGTLRPLQTLDIGDQIELDELNRNADIRALVSAGLVSITTVREPGDLVDSIVPYIGETDGFGAVHVYVSTTGNDTTGTGETSTPFRTVQFAIGRVTEWLIFGASGELVLHIGSGLFAESLDLQIPRLPFRVIVEGDQDGMQVLETGTLTAGTAILLTDSTATFGVAQELMGYPARVWNPSNETATSQWTTVRWHSNTTWEPSAELTTATPAASWRYEIYRPSTRIAPVGTASPALRVSIPTSRSAFSSPTAGNLDIPAVIFRWIEFERDAPSSDPYQPVIEVNGGPAVFSGCVVRGAALGMLVSKGDVVLMGPYTTTAPDPLMGLSGTDNVSMYGCTTGFRVDAGGYMGLYAQSSTVTGQLVVFSQAHAMYAEQTFANITCSTWVGDIAASWQSFLRIASGTSFPSRIHDASQSCLSVDSNARLDIGPCMLSSTNRHGIQLWDGGAATITGPITVGTGGIGRFGVDCRDGGKAIVGEDVDFTGTMGDMALDGAKFSWEDLHARTPIYGSRTVASISLDIDAEGTPPYAEFPVEADEAHHIYVNGSTGNDNNLGISTSPVATLAHAASRVEALLKAGAPDRDIVINIANGHYAEFVDFKPPVPPRRRIIFLPDRAAMTVNTSGTISSADTRSVTDSTKTWTINQWAGMWCKVRTAGGTDLALIQIRSNTATQLRFCGLLFFTPAALMTFQIVTPAVLVDGLRMTLPWVGSNGGGLFTSIDSRQAQVDLSYMQFGHWSGSTALHPLEIKGGTVLMQACRIRADSGYVRFVMESTTVAFGGQFPLIDDPVYGIEASDGSYLYSAGCWLDHIELFANFGNIAAPGGFVAHEGGMYLLPGRGYLIGGGALYGLSYIIAQECSGLFCWSDPSAWPTLASGITGAYCWRSKANSEMDVDRFELVGPFSGSAFLADQWAHLGVRDGVSSGTIPVGISSTRGSLVAVGQGASFAATIQLAADGTTGTFGALIVNSPLVSPNLSRIIRDTQ